MPMSIETERREERHKEDIRSLPIINPNHLGVPARAPAGHKRRHHPVLHAVLPLEPRRARPPRELSARIAGSTPEHLDVEARREVVHVDIERRSPFPAAGAAGRREGRGEGG